MFLPSRLVYHTRAMPNEIRLLGRHLQLKVTSRNSTLSQGQWQIRVHCGLCAACLRKRRGLPRERYRIFFGTLVVQPSPSVPTERYIPWSTCKETA